ncbi:MAG: hypothetical protein KGL39_46565 [Patescibacteria group bacterium]|nr:hypothetical protein [Patescibacteria group bacterium]
MNYYLTVTREDGEVVHGDACGDLSDKALDLLKWWLKTTVDDFSLTGPKIEEYGTGDFQLKKEEGSADLRLIGANVAELIGLQDAPSALQQEIGAWFYLQGKVARCVANYKQGKPAKGDTLLDIAVYAAIMRRLQNKGQWP